MSAATFTALIPMKRLAGAKTRLQQSLAGAARAELAVEMFAHVVDAVRATPCIADVYAVTADPMVAARAWEEEIGVLADYGDGLNAALEGALTVVRGAGADAIVIVQGDLPWLAPSALQALLERIEPGGGALATDHHGRGTSALAWRGRPGFTRFAFGDDSAARHVEIASAAGMRLRVRSGAPAFRDVDTDADLAAFASVAAAS